MTERGSHFLSVAAHLRPGVDLQKARVELPLIERDLGGGASRKFHAINSKTHPLAIFGFRRKLSGVEGNHVDAAGSGRVLSAIACVNVANLLLARSDRGGARSPSQSDGAGGPHLIRQFAVEGLMLSRRGAALDIFLAAWAGVGFIASTDLVDTPFTSGTGEFDVLAFTLFVAVATGLIFCMAPMLRSLVEPLNEALKVSGLSTLGFTAQQSLPRRPCAFRGFAGIDPAHRFGSPRPRILAFATG